MDIRPPVVAGKFYPGDKGDLINEIEYQLDSQNGRIELYLAEKRILGGVSPHAGYIFSLPQAVHLFQILRSSGRQWDRVILLNPNHTGWGAPLSIDSNRGWNTPLGQTEIDGGGADFLVEVSAGSAHPLHRDRLAHKREHSGEVILPLLQYFLSSFRFIPVCMGDCSYGAVLSVTDALYRLAQEAPGETLVIASSDFTHYKSPAEGRELDDYALEALLALDSRDFIERVQDKQLSICGYGPITVLMEYAKRVSDNPKATILSRGHSGESSYFGGAEQAEVVDYVSLLVYEE